MSEPYVVSATITNDGQLELSVQVDGFKPGGNVEISGQATQSGGAFANFYAIKTVPITPNIPAGDPRSADGKAHFSVDVETFPLPPHKFRKDDDVTVVLRVAKVWLTVLGPHGVGTSIPGPTWDKINRVSDMDGNSADDQSWPPSWW